MILSNLKQLFTKSYYPLNKIVVSKSALAANYQILSQLAEPIKIAPVLKSNAYGHGLVSVAKIVDELNPEMLCVDSLYEAYELLKAKIKTPILIMGYINPENLKVKHLPFSYAVFDISQLEAINKYQKGALVHLKVDTGMRRLGIPIDALGEFLKRALTLKDVEIAGLMSHLAAPEQPSGDLTKKQIQNYKKAIQIIESHGIGLRWKHLAASEGLIRLGKKELLKITNLSRDGIAFYGIDPTGNIKDLIPALKLSTQIVQIKNLKEGEKVGYSGTFTAPRDMKIAILPIGYNDGIERRLSNIGSTTIKGKQCKIVGLISMNITTIDISQVKEAKVGDEVVVYSDNPKDPNSVQNSAVLCKTVPYELLVHLSPTSIKRQIE